MRVDDEGRLLHLAWGARPAGLPEGAVLVGPGFEAFQRPDELPLTRRYELSTFADTVQQEVGLKVNFPALPAQMQPGDAAHLPIRDMRLRYADHEVVLDAEPGLAPSHGQPTAVSGSRETLRVRLADPSQPIEATLCYRLTPEHDIIERWVELANTGPTSIEVEALAFATLHLPNGTSELTSVAGWWTREFTASRERLPMGTRTIEQRAVQTGHYASPFFMLNRPNQAWEETGWVWFGTLAYSGAWRVAIEQLFTLDVRIQVGYNPFDFGLTLGSGERHVTPAVVIGVCAEGWGGASRRLHAFALERVLPSSPALPAWRPVLYNSWEATYFNLSLAGQRNLARKAAAMGVELFCVDDGWFGDRGSDQAGLGDWIVSPQVFPDGLDPLIGEVHRLGMQFG
ncbi:MAG: alpha-galactosidase, partial [Anaerolineae bacterium]|nr:alpha-galactosidase [Anaerolineae bacterium]